MTRADSAVCQAVDHPCHSFHRMCQAPVNFACPANEYPVLSLDKDVPCRTTLIRLPLPEPMEARQGAGSGRPGAASGSLDTCSHDLGTPG
eukprot:8281945-Pyramimonas_sp.AAC.1